jgi:hypothetical protein
MTFKDLQSVNAALGTMDIKGKNYVLVNERVKAFRQLYPEGTIETELVYDADGVATMKATVSIGDLVLATGYAQEKEASSYINKTSYIENCETSAVGRALGFLGIGIDTSIASAEEVDTAVKMQEGSQKISKKDAAIIVSVLEDEGIDCAKVWELYKVNAAMDLSELQLTNIKQNIRKLKERYGK